MEVKRSSNVKTAISAVIPFVLLAVMIGYVLDQALNSLVTAFYYRTYPLRRLSLLTRK